MGKSPKSLWSIKTHILLISYIHKCLHIAKKYKQSWEYHSTISGIIWPIPAIFKICVKFYKSFFPPSPTFQSQMCCKFHIDKEPLGSRFSKPQFWSIFVRKAINFYVRYKSSENLPIFLIFLSNFPIITFPIICQIPPLISNCNDDLLQKLIWNWKQFFAKNLIIPSIGHTAETIWSPFQIAPWIQPIL